MRLCILIPTIFVSLAASRVVDRRDAVEAPQPKLYTIETGPGETQQVNETQKLDLITKGVKFIDITNAPDNSLVQVKAITRPATYPSALSKQATVKALFPAFNKTNLEADLTVFSGFKNRYFNSTYGRDAATWLQKRVQDIISNSGADEAGAEMISFKHAWMQSSTIAKIPGTTDKTIVIGAHMDSINAKDYDPANAVAPGADDNGSGTVTLLEALRVLLTDPTIAKGEQANTIEFHWYSAEEEGLLGSQIIFQTYKADNVDVRAMLNQDMTGYVFKNRTEKLGIITDFTDASLNDFMRKVITGYCDIPAADMVCGYGCSDHASATRSGYQSAFIYEADIEYNDIHSTLDVMSVLSFDHMLQHSKMVVGFAYELGTTEGL